MADLPILFTDAMIRALLEGRKTQTRRVIKSARVFATPETPAFTIVGADLERALQNASRFRHLGLDEWFWESDAFDWQKPATRTGWMAHIGYAVGDRLWVRECVAAGACAPSKPSEWAPSFWRREQGGPSNRSGLWYRADGLVPEKQITWRGQWKPNIFMPRWASRLTLKVTGVQIERIRDISDDDALAEGVELAIAPTAGRDIDIDGDYWPGGPKNMFRELWQRINGKRDGCSWGDNPWVAAYTFTLNKQNIDMMKEAA